jgi:hypothetical protein
MSEVRELCSLVPLISLALLTVSEVGTGTETLLARLGCVADSLPAPQLRNSLEKVSLNQTLHH